MWYNSEINIPGYVVLDFVDCDTQNRGSSTIYGAYAKTDINNLTRNDLGFMAILHMKRSGHQAVLKDFNLQENQSIYLEDYGHIGQIDQILSIHLGLQNNQIKNGTVICMLAAGIGYVWAANIIKWGE